MKAWILGMTAVAVAGCTPVLRAPDHSVMETIQRDMSTAAQTAAPKEQPSVRVQEQVISSLLPPLASTWGTGSAAAAQPRFDLAVVDAPAEQVFSALVADTRYGLMIAPKPVAAQTGGVVVDRITLDLKNVTIQEALDAIRETYGFEYRMEGTRIFISYPAIATRLYHVNYILGQRRGVSDMQVVGGAASSSAGSGSGAGGAGFASTQASGLSTAFKTDIWGDTEDSLRTLLGCNIGKVSSVSSAPGAAGAGSAARPSGTTAARADVSFSGEPQIPERQRGKDGCTDGRALSINPMSGTILVRAMPKELRMVESLLRSMQMVIDRQVIIEAKIIDVTLSDQTQQGINWAAFGQGHRVSVGATPSEIGVAATGGGAIATNSSMGNLLGNGMTGSSGAFASGMGIALQLNNFGALIGFLQTQGQVHVLSSPRIATLNNQKAVLKVGAEEPFVTNISGGSSYQSTSGPVTIAPTMIYQPFFSGIALDVTPQVSEEDDVILHVHAMINTITEKQKISGPESKTYVPFAVNSINQADSVVRAKNGRVVVIGGLMTERTSDQRSRVPGASEVPIAGLLFRNNAQATTKRELVILLKATVVKDGQTWVDDIQGATERVRELKLSPESMPRP